MLKMFENYLALTRNVWLTWIGMEHIMDPAVLAKTLVHAFLYDIKERLLASEYAFIEFKSAGILRRNKKEIRFFANELLAHEKEEKEALLHGKFWEVLCRGETNIVNPPHFISLYEYGDTQWLEEVGTAMLKAIQCYDPLLRHVFMETLWNGLCVGVHDAICSGRGMYFEGIGITTVGSFTANDDFKKKLGAAQVAVTATNRLPSMFRLRATRYRNHDQAWYRSDG